MCVRSKNNLSLVQQINEDDNAMNASSMTQNSAKQPTKINQHEKIAYGRLRVLTAPPTSVHDMAGATRSSNDAAFPTEIEGKFIILDGKKGSSNEDGHKANLNMAGSSVMGSSSVKRSNLKSYSGSTQRLSGGNRDNSVTQFALIDDENVSALQQVRASPTFY